MKYKLWAILTKISFLSYYIWHFLTKFSLMVDGCQFDTQSRQLKVGSLILQLVASQNVTYSLFMCT